MNNFHAQDYSMPENNGYTMNSIITLATVMFIVLLGFATIQEDGQGNSGEDNLQIVTLMIPDSIDSKINNTIEYSLKKDFSIIKNLGLRP